MFIIVHYLSWIPVGFGVRSELGFIYNVLFN